MKRLFNILLAFSFLLAASCSDNLFEGNISKDSSKEAQSTALEKALNDREYQFIIDKLGGKPISSLNDREKYLLQCAYIGNTGVSAIDKIGAFLDSGSDLTDALMGIISEKFPSPNDSTIDTIRDSYSKVKALAAGSNDIDILFAAGISATLDTFMLTAKIASSLGSSFDFNPESSNYIGKNLGSLTVASITDDMLTDVTNNVKALKDAIPESGKDMKDKLDAYLNELTGGTGNENDVTKDHIVDFMNTFIKK